MSDVERARRWDNTWLAILATLPRPHDTACHHGWEIKTKVSADFTYGMRRALEGLAGGIRVEAIAFKVEPYVAVELFSPINEARM